MGCGAAEVRWSAVIQGSYGAGNTRVYNMSPCTHYIISCVPAAAELFLTPKALDNLPLSSDHDLGFDSATRWGVFEYFNVAMLGRVVGIPQNSYHFRVFSFRKKLKADISTTPFLFAFYFFTILLYTLLFPYIILFLDCICCITDLLTNLVSESGNTANII